jgi:hypothetical protein
LNCINSRLANTGHKAVCQVAYNSVAQLIFEKSSFNWVQ